MPILKWKGGYGVGFKGGYMGGRWAVEVGVRGRRVGIESTQFLIKMLWKELAKLYVLNTRRTSWFFSLGISSIICVIEIDFYCLF